MSVFQVRELSKRIEVCKAAVRTAAQQPSAAQRQRLANLVIGAVDLAGNVLGVEALGAPELQQEAATFAQIAEMNPAVAMSCLDRLAKLVALERKRARIEACLPRTQQLALWARVGAGMALLLTWPAQLLARYGLPPYSLRSRAVLAGLTAGLYCSVDACFTEFSVQGIAGLVVTVLGLAFGAAGLLTDASQRKQDRMDLEEGEAEAAQLAARLGELNMPHCRQFVESAAAKVSSTKLIALCEEAVLRL